MPAQPTRTGTAAKAAATVSGVAIRPALCIVVPVLNESATLGPRLHTLQAFRKRGAHVVVVDGGSDDNTWAIAQAAVGLQADMALQAPRGRASQMNAGAAACPADVFVFLHADTALPNTADRLVHQAAHGPRAWGRFDVHINCTHPLLGLVSAMMNLRSRYTGICTGDQALFVRGALFQQIGGFADLPLMEDIALSRALKKHSRPICLRARVTTSARRWQQHGMWRTIFLMWRLRAAYFCGADPQELAARYGYRPR